MLCFGLLAFWLLLCSCCAKEKYPAQEEEEKKRQSRKRKGVGGGSLPPRARREKLRIKLRINIVLVSGSICYGCIVGYFFVYVLPFVVF